MSEQKYVWLNLETGNFSNSWTEEEMERAGGLEAIRPNREKSGWKLIKYICQTDQDFEFNHMMQIK